MKKTTTKNVLMAILWALIAIASVVAFVALIFSGSQDNKQLIEEETIAHNETLDLIISDFSCILTLDNVDVEIEGDEVNLYISGEVCDLHAVLDKELKVVDVDTIVITEKMVVVWIIGIIVPLTTYGVSVYHFIKNMKEIKRNIKRHNS